MRNVAGQIRTCQHYDLTCDTDGTFDVSYFCKAIQLSTKGRLIYCNIKAIKK